MNRRILRRALRDWQVRSLLAISALALAAQFVGVRSALEIAVSIAMILVVVAMTLRTSYKRAAVRVEDDIRDADFHRRLTAMNRGEDDPGPAALVQKLDGRHRAA